MQKHAMCIQNLKQSIVSIDNNLPFSSLMELCKQDQRLMRGPMRDQVDVIENI